MPIRMEATTVTEESDDQFSVKSDESCGSNRVKFLCRYGGRILPRPGDGKLRYAGGNTRVVAASRSVGFADLIDMMSKVFGSAVLLKCQLPSEDLDALVSVKSHEDLENILEEYDRVGAREGLSKVRAFLFPLSISASKPPAAGHMDDRPSPESLIFKSVKPQDDRQVPVSIPHHYQITQWRDPHRLQHYLSPNHPINRILTHGSHPDAVRASAKNNRPPLLTAVPSDLQYSYMNIDVMMEPPPQHKLFRIDQSFSARLVNRNNAPQVQVR